MEKLNPEMSRISPEDSKKISDMFDALIAEGFEFTVEETADTFMIRMKDEAGEERGFGFTKAFATPDSIEARIRFPELSPSSALEKLTFIRKDSKK